MLNTLIDTFTYLFIYFNIFINDLFCFIDKCDIYNYTDDNTLGSANKNIDTLKRDLIHDTKNILEWFTNNGLQANPQKFQTMFLSTHPTQSSIDIPINDINIPTQDKVTLLGVTIDSRLKFNTHISNICSKASKQINVLRRMTNVLDVKSKLAIYQSFIKCHFQYCNLVWHFCGLGYNSLAVHGSLLWNFVSQKAKSKTNVKEFQAALIQSTNPNLCSCFNFRLFH